MGAYEGYLRALLAPLGVYDLTEGTANACELFALGAGLDAVAALLEHAERETLLATAEEEGLVRREALLAHRPAAPTTALRRAAIAALLAIDADDLTPAAINRAICGCGIPATAEEAAPGRLRIRFPGTVGQPENFARMERVLLDILPCHLETEFYFYYLLWSECEARQLTWAGAEEAGYTWESF